MRTDRKIAANMVVVAAGRVITAVSGLAIMALLTRHLGPGAFGEYRTVLAYASFAYLTSDLGLYAYTLRTISERGANKTALISTALKLRLLLALLFLSVAILTSLMLPFSPVVQIGIALATLGYLCHGGSDLLLAAFQKELRQYQYSVTEVVGSLTNLVLAYLVVVNDLGVLPAVAALVGGFVVTFACNLAAIRQFLEFRVSTDWRLAKTMLAGSMPFAGALVLGFIYSKLDIVFLALFQTSDDVGIYGIAHKVSDVAVALPYFFAGLVLPSLALAASGNTEKFALILSRSYAVMCAGGVGAMLMIVLFAEEFVTILAGADYIAGASALQIIGIKIGVFFVANLLVFATTALNMQHKMLRGHAYAAVIAVIAYFFLIPRWSYDGAAISATLAEVVILVYSFYLVSGRAGNSLSPVTLAKCAIAAVVSYWVISLPFVEGAHWVLRLLVVGPLYLALIAVLRTGAWSAIREVIAR